MGLERKEKDKKSEEAIYKTVAVVIVIALLYVSLNYFKNENFSGTIDTTILFLSVLPFIIYLIFSDKILELKGGGVEVKFKEVSKAEISFVSEEVVSDATDLISKERIELLESREFIQDIIKKTKSTLSLVPGLDFGFYKYQAVKKYLELLTKFDFFKYVLFVDGYGTFKGYIPAKTLLAQLDQVNGENIVSLINNGNIEEIIGIRRQYVKDYMSNGDALKIMEKEGITDLAVVDKNMKFKGFTNHEMITRKIINNLISSNI